MSNYYTSRKWQLMAGFDLAARMVKNVIVTHYGETFADAIAVEARREYASLIPQLPYIGGRQNPLTRILIAAALFLALYNTLKAHGKPIEEIGALVYEAVEAVYDLFPRFLLRLYGRLGYSERSRRRMRGLARESQKRRYPGDWVYFTAEGEEFVHGLDFVECGICKFFRTQDADEFAPYMCQLDFIASDRFGWELVRTMTIAEGDDKCDFRYKGIVG